MLFGELIDGKREIMAFAKEWLPWLTASIVIVAKAASDILFLSEYEEDNPF